MVPVAVPAMGRQRITLGHRFSVHAHIVNITHIIMTFHAGNGFQFLVVGKIVKSVEIHVAVDTLQLFLAVNGQPILVQIHVQRDDLAIFIFCFFGVIMAIHAIVIGLSQSNGHRNTESQKPPQQEQQQSKASGKMGHGGMLPGQDSCL